MISINANDIYDIKKIEKLIDLNNEIELILNNDTSIILNKELFEIVEFGFNLSSVIRANKIKKGIAKKEKSKTLNSKNVDKYNKTIKLISNGMSLNKALQKALFNKNSFYRLDKELNLYVSARQTRDNIEEATKEDFDLLI